MQVQWIHQSLSVLVLWEVTPCGLVEEFKRFGEIYCLHLQIRNRRKNLTNVTDLEITLFKSISYDNNSTNINVLKNRGNYMYHLPQESVTFAFCFLWIPCDFLNKQRLFPSTRCKHKEVYYSGDINDDGHDVEVNYGM
jgi:hypothetical protein